MMKFLTAIALFISASAFSLSNAKQSRLSATVNAHGDLKMVSFFLLRNNRNYEVSIFIALEKY